MVVASGRLARIFTKNPLQHRARLQNDVFLYGSDHTVRDSQDIKGSREWSRYNMCNVCNVTVQPEKGLSKVSKAEFHILHWSFFIPLFRYEFFISSIEDHAILNGFACLPYIIFGFHSPIHFWSLFALHSTQKIERTSIQAKWSQPTTCLTSSRIQGTRFLFAIKIST